MTDGLTPEQRLEIEKACERLLIEYAHARDFQQDRIHDLLATDVALHLPNGAVVSGRNAVKARVLGHGDQVQTMHHIANQRIYVESASAARATCYVSALIGRRGAGGDIVSTQMVNSIYHDRCMREDGAWKLAERRITQIFTGELTPVG